MTFLDWYAEREAELALATRAVVRSLDAGAHRTRDTGRGFQVRHHAAYRPGDDRRSSTGS